MEPRPHDGMALLSIGENKALVVETNGYAAISLDSDARGTWRVRAKPENRDQFSLSYEGDDSKTLTLPTGSGDRLIVTKPMENPTPPGQLWTLEECTGPLIFPPAMRGRLQSCQDVNLSVVVGGPARPP